MKKIIILLAAVVLFSACDKSDRPLDLNSLTVSNHVFSGCVDAEDLTKVGQSDFYSHIIILEANGDVLKVLKQSRFVCGAYIELEISNEGNTITLREVNKGASAFCTCPGEYKSEIKGMKEGEYTICVFPADTDEWYYKPFTFTFKEGIKQRIELEYIYY